MDTAKRLEPHQLYQRCDATQFRFDTTVELEDLAEIIGQQRAYEAIRFGVGIRHHGYNLFVLGPTGTGKQSLTRQFVEQQAAREVLPNDWCYIHNFQDAQRPLALSLPAGKGMQLRRDMQHLVAELRSAVPAAYESEEYRNRRQEIEDEFKQRQERAFAALQQEAEKHDIAMLRAASGLVFAPARGGEILDPQEYDKLPEEKRKQTEAVVESLEERLQAIVQQVRNWRRESQEQVKGLNRDITMSAVGHAMDELKKSYADLPAVLGYLEAVQWDLIDNADVFRHRQESEPLLTAWSLEKPSSAEAALRRYQVNVIVDHSATKGAPVMTMTNPTYPNLLGRLEHHAFLGALVTDFTLIKPGELHRANGGYLIIDAHEMLLQPFVWDTLKRCLRTREVRIESLGQAHGLLSVATLEPDPIPLDLKVVLLGERHLYYLLCELDSDFKELFKVAADFSSVMQRDTDSQQSYAQLIATLARREKLRPLHATAVARVIEHSARLVEDAEKLSTRFGLVANVLREADYWAGEATSDVIAREHVQQAIDAWTQRHNRIQDELQEETLRDILLIDTSGSKVGALNGLSVVELGDYAFGHPSRITARVRVGKGEVVDIEREIDMGGPIHSKGVLIITGFLSGRYALDHPLSLSASLVFEQTYGGVEGDSASSAELYALLSAVAGVPLKQSIAVTGSVNQSGELQSVGGINEKIEGFFDLCAARGLDGEQGVIIPFGNLPNLMLRQDVVSAAEQGRFHVYAVHTIDEGMEILTGLAAGEHDAQGEFPEGSINALVEARLITMAQQAHAHDDAEQQDDD